MMRLESSEIKVLFIVHEVLGHELNGNKQWIAMYHIVLRVWIVLTQNFKPTRNFNFFKLGGKNFVEKLKNETTDIYIFTSILCFKFVNANYKNNLNPSIYSAKHFN